MQQSAGILLFRRIDSSVEVLLVHPGGPFWATKDFGSWSVPKGLFEGDEKPLDAAKREFEEEVGSAAPLGIYSELGDSVHPDKNWQGFKQPGGKVVRVFALESDFNLENFHSNMFEMEWPPKSGQKQEFPENDRAAWVPLASALKKVVKGQIPVIEALMHQLGIDDPGPDQSVQSSLF